MKRTALISTLATKIRTSDAVLDAQAIGNACYGLQGMRDTGDSDAVGALVSALAKDPYIRCGIGCSTYW